MAGFHIECYLDLFFAVGEIPSKSINLPGSQSFPTSGAMTSHDHKHGRQEKTWYVKCNKTITALHFVQYDVLWSAEKQY
jgi:hypothetical protein